MAEAKKKTQSKRLGFTGVLLVLLIAVIGAHFSGIFTLEDWKAFLRNAGSSPTDGSAEVHFIDVGQGDCELVVSEGKSLLIDTGEKENAENVCNYMREQGIQTINYMLLTHPHSDHMGGASEIIKNMNVENIIIPKLPDSVTPTTKFYEKFLLAVKEKGLKLTQAVPGNTYDIGSCSLEILSPVKDDYGDEYNNYSAAALLTHGSDTFLFTGDIEKKAEKDIIEAGRLMDIDVLKVAHHGSSTSSCKSFLDVVKPDYAVICCKTGNSYNHPHKKTVERLENYTKLIYRTDLDGTIIFKSSEEGLSVETEKDK